jgi:3-hydroxyisobutyrate dehydrogenase-like beta-hydroxyacid dehydrogenase
MSNQSLSANHTVGVIGLGIMGGAFARNILQRGFNVVGHDVVEKNVTALVSQGAIAGQSAKDVAEQSDIVITSLPSTDAFHQVMSGSEGISAANKAGLIVVECSTLAVEDKQTAHDALASVGTILLDCPVSGTGAQAQNRDLSVYVSGEEAASKQCQPVLDAIANHTFYVGEFSNGSKMKYVANVLVAIHNVASAEAMVMGMKAGLDPDTIFNVIKAGAGNSRIFELRAPMMVEDNYDNASMKMDVWQKDMKVIGEFAKQINCQVPLFSESAKVYASGMANGMDKLDTASVCKVLEQMSGLSRH